MSTLGDFVDIVPVSSVKDVQMDVLLEVLISRLPVGPPLYPSGEVTVPLSGIRVRSKER